MRRIATLVATGAVAAAAAVGMAASPASAGIQGTGAAVAKSTIGGGATDAYTAAATHKWTSHGRAHVKGWGTYTHTSTGVTVRGYIRDTRSGKYHGGVYIRIWAKDHNHYQYAVLFAPHHKKTAVFRTKKSKYHTHMDIAEVLGYHTKSGWHLYHPSHPGTFHKVF